MTYHSLTRRKCMWRSNLRKMCIKHALTHASLSYFWWFCFSFGINFVISPFTKMEACSAREWQWQVCFLFKKCDWLISRSDRSPSPTEEYFEMFHPVHINTKKKETCETSLSLASKSNTRIAGQWLTSADSTSLTIICLRRMHYHYYLPSNI